MGLTDSLADYFGFEAHGTDLRTEVVAGITTFLAMSYIVVVNPSILANAIQLSNYNHDQTVQMIAVVTLLSSAIAMLVMAFYANRPFGLAPGLGLNAFFAFTVVLSLKIPWQTALAAVVTEGVIFILLTAVGARRYIIRLFPEPVKFAVGTGIGLFLAIIGLQEMGIVVNSDATLVTLGAVASDPRAMLAVLGLLFTLALYARGVRGSIVIGIVGTSVVGLLLTIAGVTKPGTVIGAWVQPGGFQFAAFPQAQYNIAPLVGAFVQGFQNVEPFAFALIVFTFFFVDFFDTAGTLTGVSQIGGFLDEDGNLPEIDKPLMADAVGTTVGGILGTSTVTTYIESATGVEEGGRTGMTALVVALLFLVSLVVVPLAAAVPQYAGHIALVVVGVLMLSNVTEVDWDDVTNAVPAALTIIVMPFTYSIAYGIAAGIVAYPIVKTAAGDYEDVSAGQWTLAALFVLYFVVRTSGVLQNAV